MTAALDIVLVGYRSERFLPRLREDLEGMSVLDHRVFYHDNIGNHRTLSALWNELAAQGDAPYLCILNPDVALSPGWDLKLTRSLDAAPEIGVTIADNACITSNDYPSRETMAAAASGPKVEIKDTTHTLVGLHFYCPMMKRETWAKLHGVDERLRFYNQDCEFLTRLRTYLGMTVAYVRGAAVWHYGGASTTEAEKHGEISRQVETYVSQEAWNRIVSGAEKEWHLLTPDEKAAVRARPECRRMGGESTTTRTGMPVRFVTSRR